MLTLSFQELSELTGRSQPAAQIRWLKEHNWRYEIGLDRLPKVARAYFEKRMVFGDEEKSGELTGIADEGWRVNTDALKRRFNS